MDLETRFNIYLPRDIKLKFSNIMGQNIFSLIFIK